MDIFEVVIPSQKKIKKVLWVGDVMLFRYVFDYRGNICGNQQQSCSRAFVSELGWDVYLFTERYITLAFLQGMSLDLAYYPECLRREIVADIEMRLNMSKGKRIIIREEEK